MKNLLNRLLLTGLMIFSAITVKGQSSFDSVFVLSDTMVTMNLDEFYKIILEYHPIAKQAGLLNEMARQELRLARGAFDPKLEILVDKKEFQDKSYYDKLDAYLSMPTWFPINPKIGFENNTGELLNNSETIPGGKQLFAGVNVPIGRGLFTDERRVAVKQAELFQTMAAAEQVKMLNKILLAAAKDYWAWYYSCYQYQLVSRGTFIASEIFRRVKLNVSLGEAAPIDTIQAKITLQSRLVERQEALLDFQNAAIIISNYLWDGQGEPLQLKTNVAPVMMATDGSLLQNQILESLVEQARENHPELIKLNTKLNQLEVDRKLAAEYLKPKLDINYYALSQPSAPDKVNFLNDYKFGLDFSIPLFLRKERAKLAQTKLKIQSNSFERTQAEREIINEINTSYNELKNTSIILGQQTEVVNLYDRLLQAELLNLENGESDLFKINIQQEKLIHSQSKLLKLKATYEKLKSMLYWAAGVRNLNFGG